METKEQRAEQLMRKGPIQNVRRIIELEEAVNAALEGDLGDVDGRPLSPSSAYGYLKRVQRKD